MMALRIPHMLRALRHRDLRLLFLGQGVSLIGFWLTSVASSWLVYRLTDSEFLLGVVAFSGQFPSAVCLPFAGVLVDRFDRKTILKWTQSLSMLQSALLAVLTLTGLITIPQIILLNVFQGVVNAFDMPARQAVLPELLADRKDLTNAIALNAALFHGSRLMGPAIAGILVAVAGEGICFVIDTISYGTVLYALTLIKIVSPSERHKHPSLRASLVDGARFSFRPGPIRTILLVVSLTALVGTPQLALLPVFARDVLHGGPDLYGWLMTTSGIGALGGALLLAMQSHTSRIERIIAPCPVVVGAGLLVLAAARVPWLASISLALTGFVMVTLMAGCNTLIQTIVEDSKRARVLGFYSMAFLGMMPLCGLLSGTIAHRIGAPWTVAICGLLSIGVGLRYLRPLWNLKGAPASTSTTLSETLPPQMQ